MISLRSVLKTGVATAIAFSATACMAEKGDGPKEAAPAHAPVSVKRPNVLFILVDDLRPDLGIYGHPTAKTPNMDALGRSGIVFDNAFVSQAVCGPSRAALMTGLRPDTTGIHDLETPVDKAVPGAVTLLDTFKRAGYQTLGYGKIYHDFNDDADGWSVRTPDYEKVLRREDSQNKVPKIAAGVAPDPARLPDRLNVDMALKKLPELAKAGEPFFMAVGIHRPHLPFISPQANWDRYKPSTVPAPINPEGQKGAPPWALNSYEVWNYPDTKQFQPNMPKDKADFLRWGYLSSVSYADDLVGELLVQLKQQGLDNNTIVVLWGDHGWKLGDHAKWAKHSNAEIDIHIPLMIRAPGITAANTRTKAIVETVDLYPTLAELAGLSAPENLEGLSMGALLRRPNQQWKQAAFAQYGRNGNATKGNGALMGYTVRNDRFRYTAWVKNDGTLAAQELYDLRKDRIEAINVAEDKSYAAALKELETIRRNGPAAVRAAVQR